MSLIFVVQVFRKKSVRFVDIYYLSDVEEEFDIGSENLGRFDFVILDILSIIIDDIIIIFLSFFNIIKIR